MQKFRVILEVSVNTAENVSATEVLNHVQEYLDDFDAGAVEVIESIEV